MYVSRLHAYGKTALNRVLARLKDAQHQPQLELVASF
jgi:hypothetical protein